MINCGAIRCFIQSFRISLFSLDCFWNGTSFIFIDSSTAQIARYINTKLETPDRCRARRRVEHKFRHFLVAVFEGIRQYDSTNTGHSDNMNIAAERQEPAEVLSQLDNTSNSPVYGEYKCC